MERIAKFHKVSMQQFEKDWSEAFPEVTATEIQRIYEELRLPVRATRGSAGYDFFAPAAFTLKPRETLKIYRRSFSGVIVAPRIWQTRAI